MKMTTKELEAALKNALDGQMKRNETTFNEMVLNQELGEPFRRDATKAPVSVAGIDPANIPQEVA